MAAGGPREGGREKARVCVRGSRTAGALGAGGAALGAKSRCSRQRRAPGCLWRSRAIRKGQPGPPPAEPAGGQRLRPAPPPTGLGGPEPTGTPAPESASPKDKIYINVKKNIP